MLSNLFWCAVRYGFDACFCVRYFLCLNGKELFQWFDGKLQIWNGTADATHWNCVPVRVVNYLLPFYCHYHWVLTLSSAQNTKVEIHVHLFQFWNYFLTVKNYFSGLMVNCKLEMIQRMQYIEVCSCDCFKISNFLSVAGR